MDKREIRIRLVDSRTGEILNEHTEAVYTNLYYKKNCAFLHLFLDDFISRLRSLSEEDVLHLEFTAITEYVQGKLPF